MLCPEINKIKIKNKNFLLPFSYVTIVVIEHNNICQLMTANLDVVHATEYITVYRNDKSSLPVHWLYNKREREKNSDT